MEDIKYYTRDVFDIFAENENKLELLEMQRSGQKRFDIVFQAQPPWEDCQDQSNLNSALVSLYLWVYNA